MANLKIYLITVALLLVTNSLSSNTQSKAEDERLTRVKAAAFMDPKSGYRYQVISYNITSMTTESKYRSLLKVSRIHINERNQPYGDLEEIQIIKYHATLVDFDLHCQPTYCYLVTVTSQTKGNVELFAWTRTQFDKQSRRDSFARPHAVKLFNINSAFYIAIAQDQLHLSHHRFNQEYEESARFIGCAILKFTKGNEKDIRYHQFIKLPFDPLNLQHYISQTFAGPTEITRPTENHYLVFSIEPNWQQPGSAQAYSFIWSPLNDYFWPFRVPGGVIIVPPSTQPQLPAIPPYPSNIAASSPRNGTHAIPSNVTYVPIPRYHQLKFPGDQFQTVNLTQLSPRDRLDPIEICFNQLQQVLANREMNARKLITSSRSLWQSAPNNLQPGLPHQLGVTNVSAQVLVKGNVIVKGTLIESPQITVISNLAPNINTVEQISALANDHSPAIVENRLRQADFRLRYVREKLSKAVLTSLYDPSTHLNSRVSFYSTVQARQTIFRGFGISNSDVRLNGIPFKQLEHELVSLRGSQEIASRVIFAGNVVADLLEIHGRVNSEYHLRDAVDITSRSVQVLTGRPNGVRGQSIYRFHSIASPEAILSHNATLNGIRLDDFITTEPMPQQVYGRKVFKQLSMARLDIGNPHVLLNGVNISRLATSAVFLQSPNGKPYQIIGAHHQTFSREVSANRLILNSVINQHINMTLLIHDSVKTDDSAQQQIGGFKRFKEGLRISRLTTDGAINDVLMSRVFNLNPPANNSYDHYNHSAQPITGRFEFGGPLTVTGNMNVRNINGVDLDKYVVRRSSADGADEPPQMIRGRKMFMRPLRVTGKVGLLTPQVLNSSQALYPLINNLDIKSINPGIQRQMQNPAPITIDELEIDGNLNLPTSAYGPSRTTFGNFSVCPLDAIRSRLVSSGPESQFIDVPMSINTLRARSVLLESKGLNGLSMPADFVLRSTGDLNEIMPNQPIPTEFVFGHKTFRHISIAPPLPVSGAQYPKPLNGRGILMGPLSIVNNITYGEIETFVDLERRKNSTGETVLQTLNVIGNIKAKRINGNSWPDDILLKSVSSIYARSTSPNLHRRIYSPLIFVEQSNLHVENQLVLRGPIQLKGRLNGVNLTDFARRSVTYGDKDLLSSGRPLSNKVFAGGLTVTSEVRSYGQIDGVNFDDMKRKVVLIGPPGKTVHMIGPKVFMSDVTFLGPLQVTYMNNLPVGHYLKRARYDAINNVINIYGKKTVSGALVVNQNLVVQGLINNINFIELGEKAVSVQPTNGNLQFNRTLIIEGNAYMDNLYVDENEGTIDDVKLADLQVISQTPASVKMPNNYPVRRINYNGNVTYMRSTPPYATTASYYTSRGRNLDAPASLMINPDLYKRPPMSIKYESLPQTMNQVLWPAKSPMVEQQLARLRMQFVSLNIVTALPADEIVIGFIEALSKDIANLQLPEYDPPYSGGHGMPSAFIQLDQADFSIARHIIYHCRVGLSTNYNTPNITQVICSIGDTDQSQLAVLPVESPNNAMFLKEANDRALLLFVSEDTTNRAHPGQCIPPGSIPTPNYQLGAYRQEQQGPPLKISGSVQIYALHFLENSSSLSSTYFDLYQTIDLPAIDSFGGFKYRGSTYALAVSRALETVHLLLLRGYSGFQVVSMIHAPSVDYVRVLYSDDHKPLLILHQTSGHYRLLESVII